MSQQYQPAAVLFRTSISEYISRSNHSPEGKSSSPNHSRHSSLEPEQSTLSRPVLESPNFSTSATTNVQSPGREPSPHSQSIPDIISHTFVEPTSNGTMGHGVTGLSSPVPSHTDADTSTRSSSPASDASTVPETLFPPSAPVPDMATVKIKTKAKEIPAEWKASTPTTSNISKKRSRYEDDDDGDPDFSSPIKKSAKKTPSKSKPAATPSPVNLPRSTRTRKAPARLVEEATPAPKKRGPGRPAGAKTFDPTYITTNAKSRLVNTDIWHMLLVPEAWDCLAADEKATLLSMLPPTEKTTALLAKATAGVEDVERPKELQGGDILRTDIAKFQNDLANGYLGKTWQKAAGDAMIDRAEGKYDEWKAQETEIWWGQNGG